MATITIKNVPNDVVKEIGTSIQYSNEINFLGKKRIVNDNNKVEYWDDNEIDNLGKNYIKISDELKIKNIILNKK